MAFCFVFFLIMGFRFWPIVEADLYQDDCSFGIVSNQQYRMMLAEAEAIKVSDTGGEEQSHQAEAEIISSLIHRRLDQMLAGRKTYAEKIAAVHATMRSMGAVYRSTEAKPRRGDGVWAYQPMRGDLGLLRTNYYLPSRKVSLPWLVGKWWVSVSALYFTGSNEKFGIKPNEFQLTVFAPSLLDGRPLQRSPAGEQCPIIQSQLEKIN